MKKKDINSLDIDDAVWASIKEIQARGGYAHGSPGSSTIRRHLESKGRKDLKGLESARKRLTGEA